MFTHILKRAWKNEWLTSKIFQNLLWNPFSASAIVVNETLLGQTQSHIARNFPGLEVKFIFNKRNDKRFDNRGYSLFFLMGIFLKHLWLIPNILKWQDRKIFTKLIPSQTPSRSSHWRCSVKKIFLKYCKISQENICFRVSFTTLLKSDSNTCVFLWNFANFSEHLFWRTSENHCFCPS